MEGDTHIDSRGITVQSEISIFEGGAEYSKRWVMLDYEAVREGLVIRNRRVQDFIYPSKGNGKKSLKKYFIDNKIDSDLRDKLFILAIENEIVYIENKEIGKRFRPKKGYKTLRLEFI
jgi:tRNA(Ile)-lysidine synthetase-like protein